MEACLVIDEGRGEPRVVAISPGAVVTLGRSRKNTVYINDEHASRKHAEIVYRDGDWWLCDCSTNGTYLEGKCYKRKAVVLQHEQVIRIGEVTLCFRCEEPGSDHLTVCDPKSPATEESHVFARINQDADVNLAGEEQSALYHFVRSSFEANSPGEVIRKALEILHKRSGAEGVGFLSSDPEAQVPRLVVPDDGKVDVPLSRQLTRWTQASGCTEWLQTHKDEDAVSESMAGCADAVCVPLGTQEEPLGVLHLYSRKAMFTLQQVRFAEALAGFLGKCLTQIHAQRRLLSENVRLRGQRLYGDQFIAECPVMKDFLKEVDCVAQSKCMQVLLCGETGTGKEHIAAILHGHSSRRNGPFVPVNCATISRELAEDRLFGHEVGAFTDAKASRPGFFREADDGTLFFDEIGELTLDCQGMLLRAIEGQGFRPVGGDEMAVDVRIVAATNRDLQTCAAEGKFREDLFYRFPMTLKVPPLRDRGDDVGRLARYFVEQLGNQHGRDVKISEGAIERLHQFSWPGNIRQLVAVLLRAILTRQTKVLQAQDIQLPLDPDTPPDTSVPASLKLEDVETWAIHRALKQTGWNQTEAAELLGVNRDTLRTKIKKYGIQKEDV